MADQCIRAEYDSLRVFMASLKDDLVWKGDKGLSPRLADQIEEVAGGDDILDTVPITVFYERTRIGSGVPASWECKFRVIPVRGTLAPLARRMLETSKTVGARAVWKPSMEGDDAIFSCTWE